MFRLASALCIIVATTGPSADSMQVAVSAAPSIAFTGGTAAARQIVLDAAARFADAGLALPDLHVNIHDDGKAGCDGAMGRFHPDYETPTIDLCFQREFLTLHELGHAWEHFNVDDEVRARFAQLSGAQAWKGATVPHSHRGIEIAADAIAFGLLSQPLSLRTSCDRKIALFEELTGLPAPRLSRIDGIADPESAEARQLRCGG